jgi:PAS domain S-box-containing protein
LTHEVARRQSLAQQLADAQLAYRQAEQEHMSAIAAAAARLTDHQQQAQTRLADALAVADTVEAKLGDAVAALQRAEERAAVDRQTAADEASQRRAEFDGQLAAEVTTRQELAKHLADAETALQRAERQHASTMSEAVARLVATEKEADARSVETAAVIGTLERTLADTAATLRRAEQQAAEERQAATEEAARRQAEFDAALAQQVANQHALQSALIDTESAQRRVQQQHASEIEAAAARLAEYQKDAQAQLARAAADAAEGLRNAALGAAVERQTAARQAADRQTNVERELRQAIARREAVERELAETRASAEQAQRRFMDADAAMLQRAREYEARIERAEKEFEHARMALEVDLARQRAEYTALQQILDQTRVTAEEALANSSRDRAAERVRFEALVAERDGQLRDQAARHRASHQAATATLADAEHRLNLTLEAGYQDSQTIAHLREQLKALEGQLDASRRQREVLKTEADRVPQLRKDIDDIRAENRRQFDHAPVNMCRCTQDGTISLANHAFANFLGYETPEELQEVDFAASVFESADEMQWIVERCLASHATESVETTWTRKDGSRIIVRVLAVATAPDSIDLTAEDITTLRVLEEKLRISQRMEAVARYASEVAVTCDNLLGHVEQEGLHWLARVDSDAARYHGELLLEEVTRAAKYLRQLAVYGNEEKKAPELVDMNKVLRDLEPVLKRVAGSEIDVVLPKAATPLNLDVEAERVERMLVNVAAYGRERMPRGGRLMFEVAPVVVDRKFVATYPNVRPGAHVLLTVNEVRGAARPDFSAAVRNQASGANTIASASKSPGVDLGALQALVSDCGGHLWMMVEPPGDMVLKIHLPRRVLDRPDPRTPAKASVRARWINRPAGVGH